MKVSLNWVKQYADVQLSVDQLVKKIGAQLGAVEEVIDLGKKYQGIIIAKVVSCEKHPNADKLHVCKIDDGGKAKDVERDKDGYVQVVCGAPNVREGLLVAWLPPGSTVPSSVDKDPFILEARDLRGVVSNGMLASASELAISDDHNGILEIVDYPIRIKKDQTIPSEDHMAAITNYEYRPVIQVGADFAKTFKLDDYIIDIENKMFTHRPDCFGQLGVAREISGICGLQFKSPNIYAQDITRNAKDTGTLKLEVENKTGNLVPRFMAQVFEDVKVQASPVWLQTYLMRCGVRPINNIVDITNYYMLLTAQPLHAYDYDKLLKVSGLKTASLESRMSKKGEKLNLLNGKTLELQDDTTVLITSGDVPVGVGGVMGGADTEVDENTKNIVLECATFDMYNIRKTSMKYGLFTDAVTRFNKGQSPLQNDRVVAWAREEIICDSAGMPGRVVDVHQKVEKPKMVRASVQFINERLGLDLAADTMKILLANVEFVVERPDNKDELRVTPPFWRTDIEIAEDIVEEVGRLYGFDHLPLELPTRQVSPTPNNDLLELKQTIRETLAKAGANEVLTYSFVHGNLLEKVGQDPKKAFKLSNALSPDLQYYRMSLTPSLLDKMHMNVKSGYDEFAIFELGKAHMKGATDPDDPDVPKEFNNLAFVLTRTEKVKKVGAAYYEAKRYADQLAEVLGVGFRYEPLADEPDYPAAAPYDHARSARIYVGDKLIGLVGEYKASVRKGLKLPVATAGFEIGVSPEFLVSTASRYVPLSRYPSVAQDITLKIPKNTSYSEVLSVLSDELLGKPNMVADLQPLDIYQRDGDDAHKQLTFRLTIANYEKTLKAEEVNTMLDSAAAVAKDKLKAERI
jgi:phenylalanyl-tRNA synthetase beta chain